MHMRIFDFFTIIYDEVFILQLLAVSFSIVWIFYDWKKETKNIAIGIAYMRHIFGGNAAELVAVCFVDGLAGRRGNSFSDCLASDNIFISRHFRPHLCHEPLYYRSDYIYHRYHDCRIRP